jgi:hypothetical protein
MTSKYNKKLFIILCLVLVLSSLILIYFFFKFTHLDTNDDGKTDLIGSTDLKYLVRIKDLNYDGEMDIKEYVSFKNWQVIKIEVLNNDFNDVEIIQTFYNGIECTVKHDKDCYHVNSRIKELQILHDGITYYHQRGGYRKIKKKI